MIFSKSKKKTVYYFYIFECELSKKHPPEVLYKVAIKLSEDVDARAEITEKFSDLVSVTKKKQPFCYHNTLHVYIIIIYYFSFIGNTN